MYGLIGRIVAVPGKCGELAAVLVGQEGGMPGCLSYIVAEDPENPDALWVTEVWETQADHRASLQLPQVQAAIAKGRPLIAGFDNRHETVPLGGIGLPRLATGSAGQPWASGYGKESREPARHVTSAVSPQQ
jgi:quinol monooxygenase YgiN